MKIETHCHTNSVSPCGQLSPAELVQYHLQAGYEALIITDHLVRSLPIIQESSIWEEQAELFWTGFYETEKIGQQHGLPVFPAFELSFNDIRGCDFLVYGIDPEILPSIPRPFSMELPQFKREIEHWGGVIIQAHPFRSYGTPADPDLLDGIEAFNGSPRHESNNDIAEEFGKRHGLIMTSGSDTHQRVDIGRSGMELDQCPESIHHFIDILKSGTYRLINNTNSPVPVL